MSVEATVSTNTVRAWWVVTHRQPGGTDGWSIAAQRKEAAATYLLRWQTTRAVRLSIPGNPVQCQRLVAATVTAGTRRWSAYWRHCNRRQSNRLWVAAL